MTRFVAIARATFPALMLLALTARAEAPDSQDRTDASVASASSNAASSSANARSATDHCTLLTDEEIERTTGYPVLSKKAVAGSGRFFAPGCDWELKTGTALPGLHRISIDIVRSGGREKFKLVSSSLQRVPGLGDEAVKTGGNMNGTVWAVAEDRLVTLRYALPVSTADPDPLVLPLVEMVLSRQ